MNLTNPSVIRPLMERHGFSFSRSLGQNFLINPTVCPRMAAASGAAPGVGVLEIGPGVGVLTRELAALAERVVAIEIDRRLPPILSETLADCPNVSVVVADAMTIDLRALLAERFGDMPVVVCANLPYYITSPLLMRLLEQRLPLRAVTVMVQKEAAERICAAPGTRACGAISAAIAYYAAPEPLFTVSRGSFMPAPKVDSRVLRLTLRSVPPIQVAEETAFFSLIRAAFSQRRKTLVNAVSHGLQLDKQAVAAAVAAAGLPPTARAEELRLEDFAALSSALA